MNVMNRNKLLALLLTLMLAVSVAACGSDPVDEMLGDYEKFVVKYEDLSKKDSISMADLEKLMQESSDFSANAQKKFSSDTKMSDAQTKRWTELTQRLMMAVQTLQTKVVQ